MKDQLLSMLRNPSTGNSLVFDDGSMLDPQTGESFPIRNGIPVILRKDDVFGRNRKQQVGYNLFSPLYDLIYKFKIAQKWLAEISEIMEVSSGERVLETSVGTGQQIRNMQRNGIDASFYGNDISFGMLRRCQRNMEKWGVDIGLVQGNAEALPFQDQLFDVVFHVGGFNFFNDKALAIAEMIRVARPGAKFYIADETDAIRDKPGLLGRIADWYLPSRETFVPPVDLIPEYMRNVKTYELMDDKFWMVAFHMPEDHSPSSEG